MAGWRAALYREYWFYVRRLRNWPAVLRARRTGGDVPRLLLRNGLTFDLVPPTRFALDMFREVWRDRVYLRAAPEEPPRTVVDVGAHFGFFSLQAARTWPGTRVFSFEPAPDNYATLVKNVIQNGLGGRVQVYEEAAAGARGRGWLHLKDQAECHTLQDADAGSDARRHEVATVGLRDILDRVPGGRIDFLKIDCEGAEYDFIGSGQDVLASAVSAGAIEYHPIRGHDPVRHLQEPLRRLGFVVHVEPFRHPGLGLIRFRKRDG
jgi:FkbM family methyltransferase